MLHCYFNNGRYIVIKNNLTLFHFCYDIDEFSYSVLYCISLHELIGLQELKCPIEHEYVVSMRVCLEYLRRSLFSRGGIRLEQTDLSKECHDLSQSAGWHEKDCYFNNGKTVRVVQCIKIMMRRGRCECSDWLTCVPKPARRVLRHQIDAAASSLNRWHPIFPTAHYSDGPLFRRPIVPTAHYSDQLLSYKVYNIFTSVHKITLKTVSLVERWNPQSDKLAHFLSDRNTAPSLAWYVYCRSFFTSIRRAIGRWLCRKSTLD